MDTKKVLILESVANALGITSGELNDWARNRKQAQELAAKASFDDELHGIQVLMNAAGVLAQKAQRQADNQRESWCGH